MKTFCLATLVVGASAQCMPYNFPDSTPTKATCDAKSVCDWCVGPAEPGACFPIDEQTGLTCDKHTNDDDIYGNDDYYDNRSPYSTADVVGSIDRSQINNGRRTFRVSV